MVRKSKGPVKSSKSNNKDMKAAWIVLALFVAGAIAFMFFNKEGLPKRLATTKPPKAVAGPTAALKPYKPTAFPAAVVTTPKVLAPTKKVAPGSAGRIAFVLDDWGESMRNCKYLKEIPDSLAIAILPSLKHSNGIAKCASLNNKVIMLHLPMEAVNNQDPYPVDYLIRTGMPAAKIEKILNGYLKQMPWIEGVNNHMGSKVTADKAAMVVILKRLKKNKVFFLDSMTAHRSVSASIAKELGIPFAERDIFLDNVNTREAIIAQINALAAKAREKGFAIAIGHDRELTLRVLKEQIPLLKEQGFEIVSIKSLLKQK